MTNRFVQIYKDYMTSGLSDDEAFIRTVSKIAWNQGGTIEDLREVEIAHMEDVRADFDQIIEELGEMFNERATV